MTPQTRRGLLFLAATLLAVPAASAVTIDWISVNDPGNACDPQLVGGCFGSVAKVYQIGKYEVTNTQYAEFLNAKAAVDPYGLYNTDMATPPPTETGGIRRSGVSGSYTYFTIPGRANMPVAYVSYYDAIRFANWMNNGQGNGDTETGAYTITSQGIVNNSITRNPGASIFLTSEDEWYKAAYYDALNANYFDYPAGTDTQTVCSAPTAAPNHGNCWPSVDDLTDVGAYTGSASPYGTFDQGGNVWEWNESIVGTTSRGIRGGTWHNPALQESFAAFTAGSGDPLTETQIGFRLANSIPEPTTALLLTLGLAGLGMRRRVR